MTRYDLLKQTDISLGATIIFDLGKKFRSRAELEKHLEGEITEKELQQINDAALKEGNQPLSFSCKQ